MDKGKIILVILLIIVIISGILVFDAVYKTDEERAEEAQLQKQEERAHKNGLLKETATDFYDSDIKRDRYLYSSITSVQEGQPAILGEVLENIYISYSSPSLSLFDEDKPPIRDGHTSVSLRYYYEDEVTLDIIQEAVYDLLYLTFCTYIDDSYENTESEEIQLDIGFTNKDKNSKSYNEDYSLEFIYKNESLSKIDWNKLLTDVSSTPESSLQYAEKDSVKISDALKKIW